jgi:hypothetical protein
LDFYPVSEELAQAMRIVEQIRFFLLRGSTRRSHATSSALAISLRAADRERDRRPIFRGVVGGSERRLSIPRWVRPESARPFLGAYSMNAPAQRMRRNEGVIGIVAKTQIRAGNAGINLSNFMRSTLTTVCDCSGTLRASSPRVTNPENSEKREIVSIGSVIPEF